MENTEKLALTYHLSNGVEVTDHVEFENKSSAAALKFGHDETKLVENSDGKLHKFNLKDVVLITVEPR